MRQRVIAILMVGVLFALTGCWVDLLLGEAADGSGQVARLGDLIEVRLRGNPTTGYTWVLAGDSRPGTVLLLGSKFEVDDPEVCGSPGVFAFRFRAAERGTTTLRFEYLQPWEGEAVESVEFTLVVR